MRVLRQAWWAPIAALVGVAELALSPIALAGDEDLESRVASCLILLVGGAVILAGLYLRPRRRVTGNALLLLGCGFAALWFWTVVLPLGGLIVAVGVLLGGWRDEPVPDRG